MTRVPGRSRLRDAAYRAIWAILPEKLDAVLDMLDRRAEGNTPSKADLRRLGFTPFVAKPFAVGVEEPGRQTAIIPLRGTIAHHGGWEMEASGGTSTDGFRSGFNAAMGNSNVGTIIIHADTPGGAVEGVHETFETVYSARGKGKRIITVCDAHLHSAGYWIGCAADEIVVTPSGLVGDIGVMTVHTSYAEMDAKDGIKRTLIKAGAHKGTGFPGEPLSKEDEAAIQKNVDAIYDLFVGDVAKGRGDTVANVKAGYGEGRSVDAKTAVKIGLADRVATFEQVLAELGGQSAPPAGNRNRKMAALRADADTGAPIDEEMHEGDPCPDCGTSMELQDGELVCPTCDESGVDANAELVRMAASAFLGAGADAATANASTSLTPIAAAATPPTITAARTAPAITPISTEQSMTPEEMAAERKALREAEVARVQAIRALCADHGLSLKAEKFISDDLTIDQVRAAILDEKKTVTAANRVPVRVTAVEQRSDRDPKKGFANPREFLTAVIANRARDLSQVKDDRLKALAQRDGDDDAAEGEVAFMLPQAFSSPRLLAAVGSDEAGNYSDSRGGFLGNGTTVLPGLLQVGFDGDPLAGRSQDIPMATTTVKLNARVDKDHSSSVSGGFTVSRRAETASQSATRMQFEQVTLQANSLFGFSYATEELLTDSPISFAAIVEAGFRDQFGAHLLNEKLNGKGDSEYRGILNCGATVSQAKESNQLAATIVHANVTKMRSRCWGYGNAVWIANHDTYPQLAALSVGVGTGGALVYQTSLVEDRPDMLLGRPIYYTEWCQTLGTVGDIMLLNMSQYLEGTYQPLQSAESIHVRFLNHERAFKFWTRNAADAWWRTALTPAKSSVTLSPFVTLATRS